MDKRIALTDQIYLDGVDLSNSIRSLSFTSEDEQIDVSGFNDTGASEFLPGVRVRQVEMEVIVTRGTGEAWQVLYPLHRDQTQFDLRWLAHGEDSIGATNPELRGSVKLYGWQAGGARGELEVATLTFIASDATDPLEFFAT